MHATFTDAATKAAAHLAVRLALRSGALVRPQTCSKCEQPPTANLGRGAVQAHHEDYSKPLDVTWLCPRCHTRRHAELGEWRLARARLVGPLPIVVASAPVSWRTEARRRANAERRTRKAA